MDNKISKRKRPLGIIIFLDSMDKVCAAIFRFALVLTAFELATVAGCIYFEISAGGIPIWESYIPIIEQILLFTVLTTFFAFLFDSILRKASE